MNVNEAQTELKEPGGFEVERIYVLEEFQGKGVGKALMNHAISLGRAFGKDYLWLGVWEFNYKAQAFYRGFGMETFSDHVFMMGKSPQRDVLMKLDLK